MSRPIRPQALGARVLESWIDVEKYALPMRQLCEWKYLFAYGSIRM
jgi:hypothetical protein